MGFGRVVDVSGAGEGDRESLEKMALLRQRLFTIGADMTHVYNRDLSVEMSASAFKPTEEAKKRIPDAQNEDR